MDPKALRQTADILEAHQAERGRAALQTLTHIEHRAAEQRSQAILAQHRENTLPSLGRVIGQLLAGQAIDGIDAEYGQELARSMGTYFDPLRPMLPFSYLASAAQTRDLIVATSTSGGYLVDKATPMVAEILRPASVVVGLGCTVMPGQTSNVNVPRETTAATTTWLTNEGTATTESTPAFGSTMTLVPRNVGSYVECSRQFLTQAGWGEWYVRRTVLRSVGQAIDAAVLVGAGTGGEPTGILNTGSVQVVSGTSLSWAGALDMQEKSATANASDEGIAWLARPAVREVLAARSKESGSGEFVWSADAIANRKAAVSMSAPADTLFCADWSQVLLPVWGGIVVEMNPFANFPAGIVGFRVIASVDVGLHTPASFVVGTGVS